MNHIMRITDMEAEYLMLKKEFMNDLQKLGYPKQKAEQLQVFDKLVHFHDKMMESIEELNDWLSVFGSQRVI